MIKRYDTKGKKIVLSSDATFSDIILDIDAELVFYNGCIYDNCSTNRVGVEYLEISGYKLSGNGNILTIRTEGKYVESMLEEVDYSDKRYENYPYYKKSPRIVYHFDAKKYEIKKPVSRKDGTKQGLAALILPNVCTIAFTIIMGVFLGRGAYVYMSAGMSAITMIFTTQRFFAQRKENKIFNAQRGIKYNDYLVQVCGEINRSRDEEKVARYYQSPSPEDISEQIASYSSRLYERSIYDKDFLEVSLGEAEMQSSVNVVCNIDAMNVIDDACELAALDVYNGMAKPVVLPININIRNTHLGLVGNKSNIIPFIKMLLNQVTFFHTYHDLQIVVVTEDEETYRYTGYYPHLKIRSLNIRAHISDDQAIDQVLGSIGQMLKDRKTSKDEDGKDVCFTPHLLFVIDSPKMIANHGIMEYLQMNGAELGFTIIYATEKQENLPDYIKSICMISNSTDAVLLLENGVVQNKKIKQWKTDNLDYEYNARKLSAIIHELGINSKIPEKISFFEMYGVKKPSELEVADRWKNNRSYDSLAVPLGLRAKDDIVSLNLHEKAHGPHGLVAGTTGSGKSEILQSYILSLAVNFHPYEVGFLLIDYKGGSMARIFEDLPHHLGTITNLEKNESMRALVSIQSELKRRQALFDQYNVNHISKYTKLFYDGGAKEPLPHLFIISDEFAELKKEQPDFMKELISVARLGRSLGIHLILATQKPSGIVDDQIWSNTQFKLCLKVQNESDSKEVLHTADAANIVNPGRAYLQVGNNEIYELFQSAWSGNDYYENMKEESDIDDRVYLINKLGQGEIINKKLSNADETSRTDKTEIKATIEYLHDLYEENDNVKVKCPWLPPLPLRLVNDKMSSMGEQLDLNIFIGVADIPQMQSQVSAQVNLLEEGNICFVASPGYGRSMFLSNVILQLAKKNTVGNLNFYILDFGTNALIAFSDLPHVAAHIMLDEEEKYNKFCDIIVDEIKRRKKLFAKKRVSNFATYNAMSDDKLGAIVIAIDNYDAIHDKSYEDEEIFAQITRDGYALGIYTITTATRSGSFRYVAFNNYKTKIAGYNFDKGEINSVVGRTSFSLPDIKGRAAIKIDDTIALMQLYLPFEFEEDKEYPALLSKNIQEIKAKCGSEEAEHIPILPEELYYDMLFDYPLAGKEDDIYIGLDATSVKRIGFSLAECPFIVVGEAGSGKTNLIRSILLQLMTKKDYHVNVFDSRNKELQYSSENITHFSGENEIEEFSKGVDKLDFNSEIVVIDNINDFIDLCGNSVAQDIICQRIVKAIKQGLKIVAGINSTDFPSMNTLARELKNTRNGVLVGSQGYLSIFPISSTVEKKKPFGLLMASGEVTEVMIPDSH